MELPDKLRRRARWMKLQSYLILGIIVATISGGSYLFYFAPQITGGQLNAIAERIEPLVTHARAEIQTFRAQYDAIAQRTQEIAAAQRDVTAKLAVIGAQIGSVQEEVNTRLDVIDGQIGRWQAVDFSEALTLSSRQLVEERTKRTEIEAMVSKLAKDFEDSTASVKSCLRDGRLKGNAYFFGCAGGTPLKPSDLAERLDYRIAETAVDLGVDQSEVSPTQKEEHAASKAAELLPTPIAFSDRFGPRTQTLRASLTDLGPLIDAAKSVSERPSLLEPTDAVTPETFAALDVRLAAALTNLKNVADTALSKANNWMDYARETTLRVTVIVLIVFLVQILVNLFRYGTRLAAFYEARADALEMIAVRKMQLNPGELQHLVQAFSPDGLDFGKSPRSPIDQAVEISRNLASASRRA